MRTSLRRVVVLLLGSFIVLVGVVLVFTPGPAVVVIPAGLGILGAEFPAVREFLRRILRRVRPGPP